MENNFNNVSFLPSLNLFGLEDGLELKFEIWSIKYTNKGAKLISPLNDSFNR